MPPLAERFPLEPLLAALGASTKPIDIAGVDVDLLAYLCVAVHERLGRPCVVITPGASEARRVADDLRFFAGEGESVLLLPRIEASPYGELSPDRGAVMELLAGLSRLAWDLAGPFCVLDAETLARRCVPKDDLVSRSFLVVKGQPLDRDACLRALADAGYHAVSVVEDPGTFAVRGAILDVFPPHLPTPIRVELWGDEVETLRTFDPETQRSREDAGDAVVLPPVREELLIPPHRDRARKGITHAANSAGIPTRRVQALLDDLANGIPFMGIEGFRPTFYERLEPIETYLPARAVTFVLDPMGVGERLRDLWDRLTVGREEAREAGLPALEPGAHARPPAEIAAALDARSVVRANVIVAVDELGLVDGPEDAIRFDVPTNRDLSHALAEARTNTEPLRPLAEAVRAWTTGGARVVFACRQQTQIDRLERLLRGFGVSVARGDAAPRTYLRAPARGEPGAILVHGDVDHGFRLLSHHFALVTEADLFGRKVQRRKPRAAADSASPFLQSFRELEPGDFVVHADHGVGQYDGLQKLAFQGQEADFLVIRFAGKDKLFLPVYKLGRLQKYVGGTTAPRIDKLGGTSWQKVRSRAQKSAEEDALVLLGLYARRATVTGHAFSPPNAHYQTFEARFPHEETPDQAQAIAEVLEDMGREQPMDRLLCGDVGFGKTEVALRAAMLAVLDAKQVAVLVPTTVLALQHFRTFRQRFADHPVRVELFSRLTSGEAARALLGDVKRGKVDIVIGTHRLLSKDVEFKDLGLMVLDEEHRFGVRHKESLKEMRASVDVLSMTATPIPRTLQLSLSGIRDLSVITTPPSDRLSVRTFVCRATDLVVRDAVLRELGRGGQVFFVHNRVHSIEARKAWLQALVPEARIVVGHGQMDPAKLEAVMLDFTEGRYNVLLSTTIIESGIDISNANTMLVDHADHLGLAQLYQLRGRVGRGRERGYCYLLVPGEAVLNPIARKRLATIQKFTELGSGFQVASHDMELRGAGELLGTRQKGHVQAVGVDLYAQLLEEAVRTLRGEPAPVEFDPDLKLATHARLPEEYLPDDHLRLVIYKRLANARDEEDVLAIAEDLADRFGPLPGPVENLIETMRVRTLARYVGLESVELLPTRLILVFHRQSPMPVAAVVHLVTAPRSRFEAPADFRLLYHFDRDEQRDTLLTARMCLQRLAEFVTERAQTADAASAETV